ncbi:P-loop containing nucleoside triphosphate hydrolase protein [Mycena sp. CBHHK59/15]|nr:P-loop containing nucleoside triphosphate hydrolase protein [Mycena sp. CBHHK59/15]
MNERKTSIDSDEGTVAKEKQTAASVPKRDLQLDVGEEHVRFRKKWWQIWVPRHRPPPAPASLDDATVIPFVTANIISKLTYTWITPMMVLGYQRTLQASDLWKMGPEQESEYLADKLDAAWDRRVAEAAEWNARLDRGEIKPGVFKRLGWSVKSLAPGTNFAALETRWLEVDGRKSASLAWALNDVLGHLFWKGGVFKVVCDTSQLMGPLLVKACHISLRTVERKASQHRRGIGMAIGLFCVTVLASICQHQFFWRSMTTGVLARTALTGSIYKRGVRLTGKARTSLTNSAILNHVSTDVSRIDACAQWFVTWTAPIQVIVCLIILLLGPSSLAGFALFLIVIPIQERMMSRQFTLRQGSMTFTDQRANIILEVLSAMRVVKYFCYETSFLKRIFDIRKHELKGIRLIQHSQSANIAMAFSLPVLAATLAFVTYTETSKAFDVAVIFASFSLFQLLRQPMMFLPRALSAISDARNALNRLTKVFHADMHTDIAFVIDPSLKFAVHVKNATFQWESFPVSEEGKDKKARGKEISEKAESTDDGERTPFQVRDIDMVIPRGTLAAVVGRVGSGKSSLLQGLIGEMRLSEGEFAFGGRVAYCPQSAWIQNATLRDNVLFGQAFDEDKYWRVMEDACLLPDLQLLADGDLTEVYLKGINLSGGQKQRVNIARALYYGADVVIFDDPLSAVDANVGKALFHSAILGLVQKGKTVILVTHALHFLSHCDYIYTLDDGKVAEHGTYQQLIDKNGEFARLDREFGGAEAESEPQEAQTRAIITVEDVKSKSEKAAGTGKIEGKLMVKEQRTTGGVAWGVYGYYLKSAGGWRTVPLILLSAILMQGSQVANSYALVWWEDNSFNRSFTFYQVLYALLGISQAIFTYLLGIFLDIGAIQVSRNLHHGAVVNIFHAPMSFFASQPMGRVISIFGKDIDSMSLGYLLTVSLTSDAVILVIAGVFGSVIVITILEHYFIVAAVLIMFGFGYFAAFYRASALEMKRLDSMLRSILYAHLSESLTGLPTIRSYGEIPRFIKDNKYYIDLENRALFLTVTNQSRWLAVRLDALGSVLVFLVAILAAVGVASISPAQIGLILTYTTSLTQMFAVSTRLSAEVENYMNSVERVVHYSRGDLIPKEAAHESDKNNQPPVEWPARGAIDFKNVTMSYRPGLPNVLHGISMSISPGEKIGVVGRTGAGKSSLTLCLLRIVEYSGAIIVDDVDIGKIGLRDLRSNIAMIPQEASTILVSCTVRTALDPFSQYDEARLWDALRRSNLVETRPSTPIQLDVSGENRNRLGLDTVIEADGANLSVGERSLLSLARALVKDSRVVILDEATASVDLETDNKIQRTIQTQFKDRTLICIAHRLRTILSYDRILVLDSGNIAEFDTPLNLFNKDAGVFRGLCERSSITLTDIEKANFVDKDME